MSKPPATPHADATQPTWPCLRVEHKGKVSRVIVDISVSPNAKKTELVGWHDGALRVRLSAPPVDGAANEALRRWLSEQLQVPQARVELLRGASSRRKQWALDITEAQAHHWLSSQTTLADKA
jgi:uncharacterized protein (TIGR00251 family)